MLGGENALPCFSPNGVDATALERIVYNTQVRSIHFKCFLTCEFWDAWDSPCTAAHWATLQQSELSSWLKAVPYTHIFACCHADSIQTSANVLTLAFVGVGAATGGERAPQFHLAQQAAVAGLHAGLQRRARSQQQR